MYSCKSLYIINILVLPEMLIQNLSNFRCHKNLNFSKGGLDNFSLVAHPILNCFEIKYLHLDDNYNTDVLINFCDQRHNIDFKNWNTILNAW
jgi:hypothetical protein